MSEISAVALVIYDLFSLMDEGEDDTAFHQFFGDFSGHGKVEHSEMILYEEWLLFDWRDAFSKALLERGLAEPSFTKSQHERCEQLLATNVYSSWQLVDRVLGYGFTLEDVYTGERYKIRHPRHSTELEIDSVFYARLVSLDGRWTIASGFVEPQVLHFPQGKRADFFGERQPDLNPLTFMRHRRARAEKLILGQPDAIPKVSLDAARKSMQQALQAAELDVLISLNTIESWIKSDQKRSPKQIQAVPYPLAMSLTLGLAIDCDESIMEELTLAIAMMQRASVDQTVPKRTSPKPGEGLIVGTFDPAEWMVPFEQAADLMHVGKESEAVEWFEQAFTAMHTGRSTNPLVFRQLHNAAVAYFYSGQEALGIKALAASLALNPAYDVGIKTKEALDEGQLDELLLLGKMSRRMQPLLARRTKGQRMRRLPERQASSVLKYYDWLKDLGINFYDDSPTDEIYYHGGRAVVGTTVSPTITTESKKIGRNEPCPCDSGKKYKKCHGAST